MNGQATRSEVDILADVISPSTGDMTAEAARSVLQWKFSRRATADMRQLLDRNNKGTLTDAQAERLENYRRVGVLVDLVQAKAHASLRDGGAE